MAEMRNGESVNPSVPLPRWVRSAGETMVGAFGAIASVTSARPPGLDDRMVKVRFPGAEGVPDNTPPRERTRFPGSGVVVELLHIVRVVPPTTENWTGSIGSPAVNCTKVGVMVCAEAAIGKSDGREHSAVRKKRRMRRREWGRAVLEGTRLFIKKHRMVPTCLLSASREATQTLFCHLAKYLVSSPVEWERRTEDEMGMELFNEIRFRNRAAYWGMDGMGRMEENAVDINSG